MLNKRSRDGRPEGHRFPGCLGGRLTLAIPVGLCNIRFVEGEATRLAYPFEGFKYTVGIFSDMQDHGRSTRKRTGGRLTAFRNRRNHQLGRYPAETQVGEPRLRTIEVRGNGTKTRALSTNIANVTSEGETVSTEILDVVENDANPNYVRRNIVTKGAIIETEEGRARVTSRPGQTGQVNAVAIE